MWKGWRWWWGGGVQCGCSRNTCCRPPVAVSAQDAFIFNFGNHWFAVRKLCGVWFNLDSVKKRPEVREPCPDLSAMCSHPRHAPCVLTRTAPATDTCSLCPRTHPSPTRALHCFARCIAVLPALQAWLEYALAQSVALVYSEPTHPAVVHQGSVMPPPLPCSCVPSRAVPCLSR